MNLHKRIFMISGPNGSGKTTTALSLLPDLVSVYEFINADEIARGLAPLHPENVALTAIKLMITSADNALLIDNSDVDSQKIIARKNAKKELMIEDMKTWARMQRLSNG